MTRPIATTASNIPIAPVTVIAAINAETSAARSTPTVITKDVAYATERNAGRDRGIVRRNANPLQKPQQGSTSSAIRRITRRASKRPAARNAANSSARGKIVDVYKLRKRGAMSRRERDSVEN